MVALDWGQVIVHDYGELFEGFRIDQREYGEDGISDVYTLSELHRKPREQLEEVFRCTLLTLSCLT